jgi:hypothetical protein
MLLRKSEEERKLIKIQKNQNKINKLKDKIFTKFAYLPKVLYDGKIIWLERYHVLYVFPFKFFSKNLRDCLKVNFLNFDKLCEDNTLYYSKKYIFV